MESMFEKAKRKREARAKAIAWDVKNGNYIPPAVSMDDSWFPQRRKIEKDKEAMNKLHGIGPKLKLANHGEADG